MAETAASQSDRDLASIAEARALARRAKQAWIELAEFSQERIDAIVDAMAAAAVPQAEAFARSKTKFRKTSSRRKRFTTSSVR